LKCKECGEEISEESVFCNKCGTKILVEEIKEVEEIEEIFSETANIADQLYVKKKFSSSRKIVISISAVVIVAVVLVVTVLALDTKNINNRYTQNMKQGDTLVASGKYTDAITVYGEALQIKSTSEVQSKIDKIDKILQLKKSAKSFSDGMFYLNSANYQYAVLSFQSVIKEDSKNYAIAVDKIKKYIKIADVTAIKLSQEYASNNDYASAVISINNELKIDASNQQLRDLKIKYTNDKAKADIAQAKADIVQAKADAQAKVDAQADEQAQAIAQAKPAIGMTKDEVRKGAWGQPDSINRTTTADGTTEQWVYDNNKYLYFDVNGLLTDMQD